MHTNDHAGRNSRNFTCLTCGAKPGERCTIERPTLLTPVRFCFSDEMTYDGFTDGSSWNGFLNVWVTIETHHKVLADFKANGYSDDELASAFDVCEVDNDVRGPADTGLISYAQGLCTMEDDGPDRAVPTNRRFACAWAGTYPELVKAVTGDYFSPSNGYDADDITRLLGLELGDTLKLDHDGLHVVTRIA